MDKATRILAIPLTSASYPESMDDLLDTISFHWRDSNNTNSNTNRNTNRNTNSNTNSNTNRNTNSNTNSNTNCNTAPKRSLLPN